MGSVALAEGDKPSATLTTKETEVGLIIGGDWGKGTLSFDGSEYAFKMQGAKIGGVGITVAEISGDVHQLENVEDFYGTYFKAEAGITGVVGREGSWVKNDKGVSLHLKSESKGLALSIGVEGLKISK
jgi:outer membrane immunogenic protein